MTKKIIEHEGKRITFISGDEVVIEAAQDALDLMASLRYEDDAEFLILDKQALHEDFFNLRTGLAGEILQKFVQYSQKFAIVGDFSGYSSKALRDLIRESNRGKDVFFVASEEEAIRRLLDASN